MEEIKVRVTNVKKDTIEECAQKAHELLDNLLTNFVNRCNKESFWNTTEFNIGMFIEPILDQKAIAYVENREDKESV